MPTHLSRKVFVEIDPPWEYCAVPLKPSANSSNDSMYNNTSDHISIGKFGTVLGLYEINPKINNQTFVIFIIISENFIKKENKIYQYLSVLVPISAFPSLSF